MTAEGSFRIAVVAILLLSVLVTLTFRIRAASSGENISRRSEGLLFAILLRALGLGLFVSTLTWIVSPEMISWGAVPLHFVVRWTGAVMGVFCSLLMAWTLSSLGKNLTDTVVTRANATLITNGPYRWVRHPFYVTSALLMMSVSIAAANILIAVLSVLVMTMLAIRTPLEERRLIETFGQSYIDYMNTTGRFLPRLRR